MGSGDQTIRVVIVEDHTMVLDALAAALASRPRLEIVATAGDLATAFDVIDRERPDVVLMDVRLPDGNGAEATAEVRRLSPRSGVLVLSAEETTEVVARAVEAGAAGFLSKMTELRLLPEAVEAVAAGRVLFSADTLSAVSRHLRDREHGPGHDLTDREREVLALLAEGRSTDEMAEALVVSVHTIRNHVRHLLQKLDARSKLEAVAIAHREGLVDLRDA